MTKKLLSLLLIAILLLPCLPALAAQHGPMWIEGGEGVTLTYWVPIDSTSAQHMDTYEEHPFYQWMEEQTGVHVEFVHPSEEQMSQQFNLMLTSGNYYDMLYGVTYDEGTQAAIDDGVFVDLMQYEDLMPNYFKAIRCTDGSLYANEWGMEKSLYNLGPQPAFEPNLLTENGNLWCLTQVWTEEIPTEAGAIIRKDWLDEAGLAIPQTIEDLEKVLAAFKTRGEDVIPMTMGWNGTNPSTGYLLSAFDIKLDWFTVHNGIVDPAGITTPAAKEYCELVADWYQKGYIDPDFMNRDWETMEALYLSDRLGILCETWYDSYYFEDLYTGEQAFDSEPIPLVRKDLNQTLRYKWGYESTPTNHTVLTGACEHPEIAAQWMDRLYTYEAFLRINYGVEGESYELVDGVPYFTQWYYDNAYEQSLDALYLAPMLSVPYSNRSNMLRRLQEDQSVLGQQTTVTPWNESTAVWGANANFDMNIGYVSFTGDGWAEMADPYYQADSYAQVAFMNYIIGMQDVAEYDLMAQTALDMGYAEARDLMQAAYNKQHFLPENYGLTEE